MAKQKLYTEQIEIRDTRNKEHYVVDDAYLNGYAKLCGVYATAVYNSLCRHADMHQQSFPSIDKMSEQHGVSRTSIINGVKALEDWGIVKVIKSKDKKTKRQLPNVYVLTDKTTWREKPSPSNILGNYKAESISRKKPSPSHVKSRVHEVDCKDTHIKDTHIKECETEVSVFSLKEEIEKMNQDKNRHIRIIAWYITKSKIDIQTKAQLGEVIKRHVRYAVKLTAWTADQLARAHERMIESFCDRKIDWTLETLYKILTK